MGDYTERYYAEMEAARNDAEDAYFKARPQLLRTLTEQALFRAGFERGFAPLWHRLVAVERERDHLASLGGAALKQLHEKVAVETEAAPWPTWEVEREIEHLRKQLLEVERLLQRGEIFQALAIIQRVTGLMRSRRICWTHY